MPFSDTEKESTDTTRRVMALTSDVRSATIDVVKAAQRSLSIFSHQLDPAVYDRIEFLDAVKHLILTHKFTRVRILLKSPVKEVKHGHRLVEMACRFRTFFEIRQLSDEFSHHQDAFLIADETGVVYQINADRWEGIADSNAPRIAKKYLDLFELAWAKSHPEPEFSGIYV
ncbi:MAG: hypothetical protein HKN70_10290 [Gammaproteobacteria bacterium]|nr:hypothetical protein [Gammaproteobacteria bacterium]